MNVEDLILSPNIDYCSCPKCGLRFFTFQGGAGVGRIYQELAQKDWYFHERGEYAVIKKYLTHSQKLLDVGGGDDHFRRALNDLELTVESSDPYVAARSASLKEFDYLTVLQVIEHVEDPHRLINDHLLLLKRDGLLFVSVPNREGFMGKIWRDNALDQPPHHLSHWSSNVLRQFPKIFPELKLLKIHRVGLEEIHLPLFLKAYGVEGLRPLVRTFRKFLTGHSLLAVFRKI